MSSIQHVSGDNTIKTSGAGLEIGRRADFGAWVVATVGSRIFRDAHDTSSFSHVPIFMLFLGNELKKHLAPNLPMLHALAIY